MATGRVPTTANSPLTAKGDLFGYSTTQARVPVGNDGETIVADSSTSTGLRYQSNFAAGKNAIINGDMGIWQRGTSISLTNNTTAYGPDRFNVYTSFSAGTSSFSQQTFTPGTAPVAGYEGTYFARLTCGSTATYFELNQGIEDVRKFAGQTVTFSFWAKASASIVITPIFNQRFGSGGSSTVSTAGSNQTLTTSWVRYSVTVNLPSISGKTLAAGNHLNSSLAYASGTLNSATIDTWGWQVEASNTATAFQTATGTLQGELDACMRYYWRSSGNAANSPYGQGIAAAAGDCQGIFQYPVRMRVAPTSVDFSTLGLSDSVNAPVAVTALTLSNAGTFATLLNVSTAGGLTQYRYYQIINNANTAGYLGFSAEL